MTGDDNVESGPSRATAPPATSPRARELFRRGAVYGLAGALKATEVAVAAARGAVRGAKEGVSEHPNGASHRPNVESLPREREHD